MKNSGVKRGRPSAGEQDSQAKRSVSSAKGKGKHVAECASKTVEDGALGIFEPVAESSAVARAQLSTPVMPRGVAHCDACQKNSQDRCILHCSIQGIALGFSVPSSCGRDNVPPRRGGLLSLGPTFLLHAHMFASNWLLISCARRVCDMC